MTTTRLIVTGWRHATTRHRKTIWDTLDDFYHLAPIAGMTELIVVHGKSPRGGADLLAHQWAEAQHYAGAASKVTPEPHPADWANCTPLCNPEKPHRRRNQHGEYCPIAGNWRNQGMVDLGADWAIGFPQRSTNHLGRSGTWDCLHRATKAGIPLWRVVPLG